MKIKDIKKYVIGFILGLSLVGGLVFAADSGSIGALFTTDSSGKWVLKGENIKDDSVEGSKLKGGIVTKDKLDTTLKDEIAVNTAKLGITAAQQTAISNIPTTVAQLSDASSYIKSGDDVSVNSLTINGELLQKKFSVIDQTWYPILNFGEGNSLFTSLPNKISHTVDSGKYIANISIQSMAWAKYFDCSIFVNGKLGLSATQSKNILSINDYSSFSVYNGIYDSTSSFPHVFDLKNLTNNVGLINQMYNYGSYIKPGVKYLEGGDIITLKNNVDYSGYKDGRISIWGSSCSVSVQYGEFIY